MSDLKATTRGRRFAFHDHPESDQLLSMLLSTLSELSVTRERLYAMECLAVEKGLFTKEEVESYTFKQDEEAALSDQQTVLLNEVFYALGFDYRQAKKRTSGDGPQAVQRDKPTPAEQTGEEAAPRVAAVATEMVENAGA